MKHILITLAVVLLLGCDPHIDSIYLGRAEGNMIGDVQRGNIAAVKEYLDKGGNVNLQDEPGMTPLHHAVEDDLKGSNREMVKLLIDRGANVKAIDDTHHTPLHWASNKETAELLIDAGADVNAKTLSNWETILYSSARNAAQGGTKSYQMYLGLAKLLIAKGADVNAKLKTGESNLHVVARQFSEKHASEICKLLTDNGAKVNEINLQGRTPLDEALANNRNKTADLLRKHGARTAKELKTEGK
jgi:ankyrin repeat protein